MLALRDEFLEHTAAAKMLDMYQNPICMRANVEIKAGHLTLIAAGTEIGNKETSKCVGLGRFQMKNGSEEHMYVMQKMILPTDKTGVMSQNAFVAAFWHIVLVDEAKDANMKLTWEARDIQGFEVMIPKAVSIKKLKKGDVLKRLKVKGTPKPPDMRDKKDTKRQRTK